MRKVAPLDIDHSMLYEKSIQQTLRDADKTTLSNLKPVILRAGSDYDAAMLRGAPAVTPITMSNLQKSLVKKLYDMRMVNKRGACRQTYDMIRDSLSHCPFCESGEVWEVDHFLPQSKYPELNIYPKNLVPICHPCNHIKLTAVPTNQNDYFLHPYFDELPNVRWLFARMEFQGDGPVLIYSVSTDRAVCGPLTGRLSYHFTTLQLSKRFRKRSSKILLEIQTFSEEMHPKINSIGLRKHFTDEGERIFNKFGNTIEAAAYTAAGACEEFCNGRFRN
jgi:hypothetical protein